jgi:hypothetical protein
MESYEIKAGQELSSYLFLTVLRPWQESLTIKLKFSSVHFKPGQARQYWSMNFFSKEDFKYFWNEEKNGQEF